MILKIFKAVWFLSLLVWLLVFLYVYASLPEGIIFQEGESTLSVSRNGLFYTILLLLAIFNALVFIVSRLYPDRNEYLKAWFYGLIIFLNLFLVVALQFLSLFNSQEKFDYGSIGVIIYGSIGMVVLWSSLWPLYFLTQRFLNKPTV